MPQSNNPLWGNVRGGMVGHTIQAVPTMEKYDASRVGGYGSLYGDVVNLTHPLVLTDNELMTRRAENVKIYANLYVSIEPLKGLKYKLNFTPDVQFYRYNEYQGLFDCGITTNGITQVVTLIRTPAIASCKVPDRVCPKASRRLMQPLRV